MTKKVKSRIIGFVAALLGVALIGGVTFGASKVFSAPETTLKTSEEVDQHDEHAPKIYGVEGEINSTSLLTRTGDAVGMTYTVHTTEGLIDSDFDNAEIYKDIKEYTDVRGNVFVSIPKYYVKYTWNEDNNTLKTEISKYKYPGFILNPCFRLDNGIEIDSIKIGKYDASGSSEIAASVSGASPLGSLTIDEMRTACKANNTSAVRTYQQLDLWSWVAVQDLFKVEFATTDSQSVMRGRVDAGSLAASGSCNEIGVNKSGWDLTTMCCTYRGIENPWGNTNQWLDGINLLNYEAYVCYKTASYHSEVTDGDYKVVDYHLATGSGNTDRIGFDANNPFVRLAVHYNGSDYDLGGYYNDSSYLGGAVMYVGGDCYSGSDAGLFKTSSYSASLATSGIGCRLLLK